MVSNATAQNGDFGTVSSGSSLRNTSKSTTVSGTINCSLLNRCRLIAPLGRGGMAEVFLAACEVTPTERYPVAVKRLYSHIDDDPVAVQMFHDEARLVASLSHENIVKLYEVGVLDNQHCLVMEYLEGQPLQRLMHRRGHRTQLALDVAVHITLKILEALEHAHNAKDRDNVPLSIIHRDVSPHNVFIANDGCVKLLDFGIAKASSHEGRTATGLVKGKFAYIAPEQAMAQPVDGRSDLWSVGVILWEMISGRRLFKADNEAATLRATLRADVPRLAPLRPEVTTELERIVARALQRNPSQRYGSASEMKHDLLRHLSRSAKAIDSLALANLMQTLFAAEILEQKRVLANLATPDFAPQNTPYRAVQSSAPTVSQTTDTVDVKLLSRESVWTILSRLARLLRVSWLGWLVVVVLAALLAFGVVSATRTPPSLLAKPAQPQETAVSPMSDGSPKAPIVNGPQLEQGAASHMPSTLTASPAAAPMRPQIKTARFPADKQAGLPAKQPTSPSSVSSASAEPSTGYLSLDTIPWSHVSFKGKPIGQTPIIRAKLPTGTHVLVLRNPDAGIETTFTVNIAEGAMTAKRIGLE